jgi:FkbM family methyltransferase
MHHCDEYTSGPQLRANRTHATVFDIGFHSGDDTLHFLEQGHDVLAIDANPEMIRDGLTRPALHFARQHGRLNAIASGISDRLTKQALSFYVHNSISEWSRFTEPPYAKRRQFNTIRVPVTTCGELIRQFGVPVYMKVDIEGYDSVCLHSLEVGRLPMYVSTEDPTQLDHLISIGYCAFKMVSQSRARRGGRQFSGGMPEDAPGVWVSVAGIRTHPFFSLRHMHVRVDLNGKRIREEHDLHGRRQGCLG